MGSFLFAYFTHSIMRDKTQNYILEVCENGDFKTDDT